MPSTNATTVVPVAKRNVSHSVSVSRDPAKARSKLSSVNDDGEK